MPVCRGKMVGRDEKPVVEDPQELSSDLAQLMATERRLDRRLAEVRAEAERLVEAAREESRTVDAAFDRESEAAAERLRVEIEAERAQQLESIAAEARQRIEAFDGIPDGRIGELSEYVVGRLTGEGRRS